MATALTYLLFSLTVGLVLVRSYGRYIIVVTNAVAFAGVFLPRYWYLNLANLHPINLVLYGAGRAGNAFLTRLRECAAFRVVGFLDQQSAELPVNGGPPILGSLETVDPAQLRQQGVDVVVICVGDSLEDRNATRLLQFPLYGLDVLTMGAFSARYFREFTLDYHCPHWFTSMSSLPGNPTIFWVKRAMDLAGAITLLALTLPFWPLVALLIKLDSRGPVFFRQTRVGRFGRPFEITKFRTMEAEAEKNGAVWAQPHDPRITRLGGLLRLTRIDELPQLLNVVHGEMSIVGPRPERPEFVGELIERHPLYAQRHLVPPGLTGWAQIRFGYGATYEDAKRKLELDLYYVRHLSIAFDVEILLKTLFLVMKGSR